MSLVLRKTALISFCLGFPLFLAHGIAFEEVLPALGLIPLAASFAQALYLVLRRRPITLSDKSPASEYSSLLCFVDLFLGFFHLGFLVPSIVFLARNNSYYTNASVLAAYDTVFMMTDMTIHFYLVIVYLFNRFRHVFSRASRRTGGCAHCGRGGYTSVVAQSVGAIGSQSPLIGSEAHEESCDGLETGIIAPDHEG